MHDLKLEAVVFALKTWQHYLWGKSLSLHPSQDSQVLVHANGAQYETEAMVGTSEGL